VVAEFFRERAEPGGDAAQRLGIPIQLLCKALSLIDVHAFQ